MYSIMLYMKTRMTFRLSEDLAETLRHLPNQTHFVEEALRNSLGTTCPLCEGTGKLLGNRLQVSNLKKSGIKMTRNEGQYLKQLVRLARDLAATNLHIDKPRLKDNVLDFLLTRNDSILFSGSLDNQGTRLRPN